MRSFSAARRLQAGAAAGLLCAIVAFAAFPLFPARYVSQSTVQFASTFWPGHSADQRRFEIDDRLSELRQIVTGHAVLADIVRLTDFRLYGRERQSMPVEDITELMRARIRFWAEDQAVAVHLSFEASDPAQARLVTGALVSRMLFANQELEDHALSEGKPHVLGKQADIAWVERSVQEGSWVLPVMRENQIQPPSPPGYPDKMLMIVEAANLPAKPEGIGRWSLTGLAFLGGFLLAQAILSIPAIPWRAALWMLASTLAGFLLVEAFSLLFLPDEHFPGFLSRLPLAGLGAAAALTGCCLVRAGAAWRRPSYGWSLVAGAAVGALFASASGFLSPVRAESTALLRLRATQPTTSQEAIQERLLEIEQMILSRGQLAAIIVNPAIGLYTHDRDRYTMQELVERMRTRDLRIEPAARVGAANAIRVSFASMPETAKMVVDQIVAKILETSTILEKQAPKGVQFQAMEPSNLPPWPVFPESPELILEGAGIGAALALLGAFWLRRTARQKIAVLAAAGCGALVVSAFLLLTPVHYSAVAKLRIRPDPAGKVPSAAVADFVREQFAALLSTDRLTAIMQRWDLDLYRRERSHEPLPDVAERMRHDLRITEPSPGAPASAFTIEYEAADSRRASETVSALVTPLMMSTARYLKGLDKPPELELLEEPLPSRVPRPVMQPLLGGALLGWVLASAWVWRPRLRSAH